MDWPAWLTEARIAMIVAAASALFSGGQFFYTRRLAINDSEKMKRRPLVLEGRFVEAEAFPNWMWGDLTIRNLEPVSASVTGIYTRSKTMRIVESARAYKMIEGESAVSPPARVPIDVQDLPQTNRLAITERLLPVGSRRTSPVFKGSYPTDVTSIRVLTYGVRTARDLGLEWDWADGQSR